MFTDKESAVTKINEIAASNPHLAQRQRIFVHDGYSPFSTEQKLKFNPLVAVVKEIPMEESWEPGLVINVVRYPTRSWLCIHPVTELCTTDGKDYYMNQENDFFSFLNGHVRDNVN